MMSWFPLLLLPLLHVTQAAHHGFDGHVSGQVVESRIVGVQPVRHGHVSGQLVGSRIVGVQPVRHNLGSGVIVGVHPVRPNVGNSVIVGAHLVRPNIGNVVGHVIAPNVGRQVCPAGTTFMDGPCRRCQCYGVGGLGALGGTVRCTSLCGNVNAQPRCGPHQREVITGVVVTGTQCTCHKRVCVGGIIPPQTGCPYGGRLYRVGEKYMSNACVKCQCLASNKHTCASLCPEKQQRCAANQKEVMRANRIPGTACNCPKRSCVDQTCTLQGKTYQIGEDFMSGTCKKCKCYGLNTHRCITLCPAGLEQQPRCGQHQNEVINKFIVPGSECSCPKRTCVNHVCKVGEQTFRIGELFMANTCNRCVCVGDDKKRCESLCPSGLDKQPKCGAFQREVIHPYIVAGSSCSCPRRTCINIVCNLNGRIIQAGQSVMLDSCTKCQCQGENQHSCTPLCALPLEKQARCTEHQREVIKPHIVANTACNCPKRHCIEIECNVGEKKYRVGETFMQDACTKCECVGLNNHRCTPLCPMPLARQPRCGAHQREVISDNLIKDSSCNCQKRTCIDKVCTHGGQKYRMGQLFMENACSRCQCVGDNEKRCTPLCPITLDKQPKCAAHQREVINQLIVVGTSCKCPRRSCVDMVCNLGGQIFRVGEKFMRDACTKCQCTGENNHQCSPMCPKTDATTCGAHQRQVVTANIISGTMCSCNKNSCVDKVCVLGGKTFKVGEEFMANACVKCKCNPTQRHTCEPLCPRITGQQQCQLGQREVITTELIKGTNCNCPKRTCVGEVGPVGGLGQICIVHGRIIPSGMAYMEGSCSRCVCQGRNQKKCGTICPTENFNGCQAGQREHAIHVLLPGTTCHCARHSCIGTVPTFIGCTVGGNQYRIGQQFTEGTCSRCSCLAHNNHKCVQLCPAQVFAGCPSGSQETSTKYTLAGTQCQCARKSCKAGTGFVGCTVNGKQHRIGDKFMESACLSCRCYAQNDHKCEALCPNEASKTCPAGQTKVVTEIPISNTQCTCKKESCQGGEGTGTGTGTSTGTNVGTSISSQDAQCKKLCAANNYGVIPTCTQNQRIGVSLVRIAGTGCNCAVQSCV